LPNFNRTGLPNFDRTGLPNFDRTGLPNFGRTGLLGQNQGYQTAMARDARFVERETKFSADWDFDPPDLRATVGRTVRLPEEEFRTRYFDTKDFRLWGRGITVRHRQGEGAEDGVWTVKLPEAQSGPTLERTELSWPGRPDDMPAAVTDLLAGIVRRASLQQVTEMLTTRRRLALAHTGGSAWGELDDDICSVIDGPRRGRRFRQLELEVEPGAPDTAERVLAMLRRAGARPAAKPKLAEALGLATRAPSTSKPRAATKKRPLGELVQSAIRDGLDRLLDHDYRLRLDAEQPSAHDVHQARVATRRLRSNLKLFAPLLDPVWVAHTRAELRWLGETLGAVRDCDVLAQYLDRLEQPSTQEAEGQQELRDSLDLQRSAAAGELASALQDDRYLNLVDRLHAAAERPPFDDTRDRPHHPAETALPALVDEHWRRLHRKLRNEGRHPTDHDLHRTRIRAKGLRYAAEAATPVIGKPARQIAAVAEDLQTVLGEHHDAVVAEQWLRQEAATGSAQKIFRAGELTAEQRLRQAALRQHWRPVADQLGKKKLRPPDRWSR
jgi:CHAD domain-containing protein